MSNCNDLDLNLVDYLEGELPEEQAKGLDAHVESCEACAEAVRDYRQILSAYGDLEQHDVPEAIAAEIMQAARSEASAPGPSPARREPLQMWKPMLAFAASVLLVFAFVKWSEPELRGFDNFMQQGMQREAAGDVAGAIESFENAVDEDSTHAQAGEVLESLARLHLASDQPDSALAALNQLASRYPVKAESLSALILRLEAYQILGDASLAGAVLEQALASYPENASALEKYQGALWDGLDEDLRSLGYIDVDEKLEALGYTE